MATPAVPKLYVCGDYTGLVVLEMTAFMDVDLYPVDDTILYGLVRLGPERKLLAYGGETDMATPYVWVRNLENGELVSRVRSDTHGSAYGSLNLPSLSTNPILVNDVILYDALTGDQLLYCLHGPTETSCVRCFSEWCPYELFAGGVQGFRGRGIVKRFDVNQAGALLGSYGLVDTFYINAMDADVSNGVLFTGSEDGTRGSTLSLWSKDEYQLIHSIHLGSCCNSLLYHEGSHLLCAGTENEIEIWDIRNTRTRVLTVNEYVGKGSIYDLCHFTENGNSAIISSSSEIAMWDLFSGKILETRHLQAYAICAVPETDGKAEALQLEEEEERIEFVVERKHERRRMIEVREDNSLSVMICNGLFRCLISI